MARYLLIASRDPYESNEVGSYFDLATQLAEAGNTVTVFLVQNGVLPARREARAPALARLAGGDVEVLADEFSLRERGIDADRLADGVQPAPLDAVVDRLADGCKAMWH